MSCSGNNQSSRKGKGRQKVEMVKIGNDTNLQVTFSKRRAGLFKKASELSTLCGAETAMVVFSPGNKAHCFGHPSIDVVTNRFLNQDDVAPMTDADKLVEAHQRATINQQNLELTQIQKELEFEQKRSRELEKERNEALGLHRRPDINKLNYEQLDRLQGALMLLRHQLQTKVDNATGVSTSYVGLIDDSDTNSTRINSKVKNPNVQVVDHGLTIPYDPMMASESCPIVPYSSTTSNGY